MKIIQKKTFSLIELLVTIAVIAILAGLLLPALNTAREKGRGIACAANLKQIGIFLLTYADDNNSWGPDGIDTNFHFGGNTFAQLWQDRLMLYYMPDIPVRHVHHAEVKDGRRKIRPIFTCPASGYTESSETDSSLLYRNYGINYHMAAHEKVNSPFQAYAGLRLARLSSPSERSWVADRGANTKTQLFNLNVFYIQSGAKKDVEGYDIGYRHVNCANFVFADGHTASKTFRLTPESYADYFFSSANKR